MTDDDVDCRELAEETFGEWFLSWFEYKFVTLCYFRTPYGLVANGIFLQVSLTQMKDLYKNTTLLADSFKR